MNYYQFNQTLVRLNLSHFKTYIVDHIHLVSKGIEDIQSLTILDDKLHITFKPAIKYLDISI